MGRDEEYVRALAEKHRADALANLALLEAAAAGIAAGDLDPVSREEARVAAHKLRGSFGVFGRRRAGEIAGSIEDVLQGEGPIPHERAEEVRRAVDAVRAELEQ